VGLELLFQACFSCLLVFLNQILKSMNKIKPTLCLGEAVASNVRLVSLFPHLGALTVTPNLMCSVYVGTHFSILPVWLVSFLCLHSFLTSLIAFFLFVCLLVLLLFSFSPFYRNIVRLLPVFTFAGHP